MLVLKSVVKSMLKILVFKKFSVKNYSVKNVSVKKCAKKYVKNIVLKN